jgi:Tfp pilus assembly protein PilN
MMVFNLLQYPALASQRRKIHRRWTSWAGLVAGSLVAVGVVLEVQGKQERLLQERALLASRLKLAQNQLASDKARQAQHHTWHQQEAHLQLLIAQQRRWEALFQALLREAGPETVQLQRLQFDAQTLELHGLARDVQRMALARARLSSPGLAPLPDVPWMLVSMVNASVTEGALAPAALEFVWRTDWPQVGAAPVSATPVQNPLSSESLKERP